MGNKKTFTGFYLFLNLFFQEKKTPSGIVR